MTLNEASGLFQNLILKTTKTSEIKIYQDFILIIDSLNKRSFSKEELQSIQVKLTNLNLNSYPTNKRKYLNKDLNEFKQFLNKTFSIVPKNYYMNIYISLGAGFCVISGIIIGERFDKSAGIAIGISFGMLIGLFIGKIKDIKAKNEGRVI